jgi:hypothetical protein
MNNATADTVSPDGAMIAIGWFASRLGARVRIVGNGRGTHLVIEPPFARRVVHDPCPPPTLDDIEVRG